METKYHFLTYKELHLTDTGVKISEATLNHVIEDIHPSEWLMEKNNLDGFKEYTLLFYDEISESQYNKIIHYNKK